MKRILLFLIIALITLPSLAWQIKHYRNAKQTGGYNFVFYTPNEAEKKIAHPHPLIIFLHGASLSGDDLKRVERYGPIDAVHKGLDIPAYVMAPQCRGGWKPEVIKKTLEWVQKEWNIDSTRIYVIGMSMGGYGTLDFTSTYPNLVAAAMGICGGITKPIDPLVQVPLWMLHGTADRPVPISNSDRIAKRIREINKGERLIYTRLPGINHGQPARFFYRHELYDWLFCHKLTDVGRPVNRDYKLDVSSINNAYRDLPGHGRTVR